MSSIILHSVAAQESKVVTSIAKQLASCLPRTWQVVLRELRYRSLIRRDRFNSDEPEFQRITDWVAPGDWVIDVGANIGTYTRQMSRAVGRHGRVIALEPVPLTFRLLCQHVDALMGDNVTLLNLAASDRSRIVAMRVPRLESGLENLYQSKIVEGGSLRVLAVPLDVLSLRQPIRLVKVDVEGHEMNVLRGAVQLIERDRPVLILEGDREDFLELLVPMGYRRTRLSHSPNVVYLPE